MNENRQRWEKWEKKSETIQTFRSDHVHLSLQIDSRVRLEDREKEWEWKKRPPKNEESFVSDPSLDTFIESNKSPVL